MGLTIDIQKKPEIEKEVKISTSEDVFQLEEVQEIKDAIQEHLLFIGLDNKNNVRNISLIGIGTSTEIKVDIRYIVRIALINACDKVILVHNHPSNELNPSIHDKNMSNIINKLLKGYNIKLLDHIIVGRKNYLSMENIKAIDRDYKDDKTKLIDNAILTEENLALKQKVKNLNRKLQKYEKTSEKEEEEFE
ncbi:MAG: JAB domain-containing protein [Clostridia bacterium]|nr:JAB domain-containing protein [Clostridia bacterium]